MGLCVYVRRPARAERVVLVHRIDVRRVEAAVAVDVAKPLRRRRRARRRLRQRPPRRPRRRTREVERELAPPPPARPQEEGAGGGDPLERRGRRRAVARNLARRRQKVLARERIGHEEGNRPRVDRARRPRRRRRANDLDDIVVLVALCARRRRRRPPVRCEGDVAPRARRRHQHVAEVGAGVGDPRAVGRRRDVVARVGLAARRERGAVVEDLHLDRLHRAARAEPDVDGEHPARRRVKL